MKLPGGRNALLVGALSLVTAGAVVWSVTGSSGSPGATPGKPGASASSTGQRPLVTGPPVVAAPPVLGALPSGAPQPSQAGLSSALEALLRQHELGPHVGAAVVDVATGTLLFGQDGDASFTPASTTKLLTAAAALARLGPDYRIETKVVAGSAGQIILVGGGDPTLSTTPPAGFLPAPASMPALARSTAAALKAKKLTSVKLGFDTTLFVGPRTAPTWPASYVSSGIVSPVTALSVDEGRIGPIIEGTGPRVTDPPVSAARSFARLLKAEGIKVVGVPAAVTAGSSAATLASVRSPQLSDLVGWMLSMSDNDLAEAIAHLTGKAAGDTADFAGGARAVRAEAEALGLPTAGLALYDGSGLTPATTAAPADLAGVLSAAARSDQAALRPLLTSLSVSGFSGTLADRFKDPGTRVAAGLVRAKTGTLSRVGALAGTTVDAAGRVLAFAFLADRVPAGGTLDARAALDRVAARLVACGCR